MAQCQVGPRVEARSIRRRPMGVEAATRMDVAGVELEGREPVLKHHHPKQIIIKTIRHKTHILCSM